MSKIFLHIGMHKTGSTAIQSAFAGYETSRARYADLGYENHSIPFYTAYSGQHHNYHIWRAAGLRPEEIEAQKDICRARIEAAVAGAASEERDLIFSGEDISNLPRAGVEELHALFTRYGCDVRVIIYVREPVSFVQSNFQEDIKAGFNTRRPKPPNFRARIEKFIQVYGAQRVSVRVFDRAHLHGNDIVKDFAKLVDVTAPRNGKNDNSSLSTEAVKIIYLMNQLVPVFGEKADLVRARWRMLDHVRLNFTGRFELPDELLGGISVSQDLDWLHDATGIDFRRPEKDRPAFSEEALSAYLSQLETGTIEAIRGYLARDCGLTNPPEDTYFLLARYFMSFLNTGWPFGFKFNPDRYLELNPDVRVAGVDPYKHYLEFGLAEGRAVQ